MFGPGSRFPYAETRSYTPPDAPLEKYLHMLDTLGFARGGLVQGSAHGRDNSAMLDALAKHPERLRGVAVADESVPAAELRRWNDLGIRALRFNHFFRDGKLHYQGGVTLENAKKLGSLMKDLGWHMQLWIDVKDLPETIPIIKSIGLPVVIDHMGRTDARAGINTPGFQSLVRLVGEGGCWVKMSGAHRLSTRAPDYPDARPFHEALVAANPGPIDLGHRLAASAHRGRDAERRPSARSVQRMDAGRERAAEDLGDQSGAALWILKLETTHRH